MCLKLRFGELVLIFLWRLGNICQSNNVDSCGPMGLLPDTLNCGLRHAPGMPGTFSPPLRDNDPDMHHDTCVTHVPWCISGSLTCGFLWSRWRRKRSRHSRRMRNLQFYISGKRPMTQTHPLCTFVRASINSLWHFNSNYGNKTELHLLPNGCWVHNCP